MASLRNSRRKQQTRLSFNPLPTSSPVASGLPEQLQSQAAAVRYDTMESPTKKRRLRSASGQVKLGFEILVPATGSHQRARDKFALPTPEPSSQIEVKQDDNHAAQSLSTTSDDEPITPRTSRRQRTYFMGTQHSGNLNGPSTPLNEKEKHKGKSIPRHGAKPLHPTVELSSSKEGDGPSRRTRASKGSQNQARWGNQGSKATAVVSSEEDSEPIPLGYTKEGIRSQDASPRTPQTSRRTPFSTSRSGLRFLQGGSTGSAPINRLPRNTIVTPTRPSRRTGTSKHRNVQSTKRSEDSSSRSRRRVETQSDDSSDSLMNELRTSTKKSEEEVSEEPDDSEDTSDDAVKSSRRRRHAYSKFSSSVDCSDSEEEHQEHKGRPKDDEKQRTLTRAKRPPAEKSARQKQLEVLRKRRAGEDISSPSDDDDAEIDEQDRDPYTDTNSLPDQDESSGTERVRRAIPPNLDEYEADFVDDDASDTLGIPPTAFTDIPLEFTRHAHKKPIEHFKDIVEWMVHNKLNPAFPRDDPVYAIAVRKLDDVVQGYAGSKFMSSAWKAEFLTALRKYPDCATNDVPPMFDQKCEACGRSGHPAKHQLVFSGKPYHRESLEDISSDEESDDELDSQHSETQTKAFFLGRTCNANAETAHALYHWRHQLNHFVLTLLRSEGHFAPEKIVERSNWSTKKKEKYANGVVDGMEADGQMRELYKEFKENLEAAREAKNEGYYYGRKG
ncbi:MAG: hypothetical protein Q9166_004105 [cf. Caloplaca sp. 2 TL-2023]